MREWQRNIPNLARPDIADQPTEPYIVCADLAFPIWQQQEYMKSAAARLATEEVDGHDSPNIIAQQMSPAKIGRYIGKCLRRLEAGAAVDPDATVAFNDFQPRLARHLSPQVHSLVMAAHEEAVMGSLLGGVLNDTSELPQPPEPPTGSLPPSPTID